MALARNYYDILPKDIKDRAVTNAGDSRLRSVNSMTDALKSFVWDKTEEGELYWDKLNNLIGHLSSSSDVMYILRNVNMNDFIVEKSLTPPIKKPWL